MEPPPLRRHNSAWDRAKFKLRMLFKFENATNFDAEPDDPMPRCVLRYDERVELLPLLPPNLRTRKWQLRFSSQTDGCSLKTLYSSASASRGPTVVLVRDVQRHVFGAFVASAWQEDYNHYQGSAESFVFSTWPDGFRSWAWSGKNRHIMLASRDSLGWGGGGHFGAELWSRNPLPQSLGGGSRLARLKPAAAMNQNPDVYDALPLSTSLANSNPATAAALWLGDSLASGSTARSETFDNEPLTEHFVQGGMPEPHSGDSAFQVLEVQVWSFQAR